MNVCLRGPGPLGRRPLPGGAPRRPGEGRLPAARRADVLRGLVPEVRRPHATGLFGGGLACVQVVSTPSGESQELKFFGRYAASEVPTRPITGTTPGERDVDGHPK